MIRLRDIHKEYQNGTKALKGVSMQIDDGDFVFLVGPSGSGKSTIIKLITAEISPTRGKLMVNGYNLNDISEKQIPLMRRTIGVVFQDFRLIEKKTVYDNLAFVMRAVGASPKEIRKRIPSFTMDFNIDPVKEEIARSWPDSLDDTCAREEWGWRPEWDLSRMTDDMLAAIRSRTAHPRHA